MQKGLRGQKLPVMHHSITYTLRERNEALRRSWQANVSVNVGDSADVPPPLCCRDADAVADVEILHVPHTGISQENDRVFRSVIKK